MSVGGVERALPGSGGGFDGGRTIVSIVVDAWFGGGGADGWVTGAAEAGWAIDDGGFDPRPTCAGMIDFVGRVGAGTG
jgi:hypothetical protein